MDDRNTDIALILTFNNALNARDVGAMIACLSEDTVFENTEPAPDGTRYSGLPAVRSFWEDFFRGSQQAMIEVEDIFGAEGRYTMLWTYRWVDLQGAAGHVRGVDVYRVVYGKITEKLSYVKG